MMTALKFRSVLVLAALALVIWAGNSFSTRGMDSPALEANKEKAILVQYLEIVTPDVDATCAALEKLHGVSFGKPEAALGNARTAPLTGGGRIGVRAPLRKTEDPVIRPYVLVDDKEAAVKAAKAAGGEIAMSAETPGLCKFAIYFQGGIQYGLWEPLKK
jgi:predicted enzyme related to lactoylglutathione lyase